MSEPSILEFLSYLRSLNVELRADGDHLAFSAPAGKLTPELRTQLAAHKAALLRFLQEAQASSRRSLPPLVRVPRDGNLPLSFAQQGLWFLEQVFGGLPVYNIAVRLRIEGALNVEALERSLREIVRRHEALRTTFRSAAEGPTQIITLTVPFDLAVVDLSSSPQTEREKEAERRCTDEARRAFDLTHGPLFLAQLFRLSENEHWLLLKRHHLISDGWSQGVMFRELTEWYAAFARGESPVPAELPIQYADFAVWQRAWLNGAVLEDGLIFWRKQLAGAPLVLELPADHPRPTIQRYRGATCHRQLDESLAKGIIALSQRENATLFMVLMAVFQVLIHRHTQQVDFLIGTPSANRNRKEVEGLIGCFVNTLVLRADVSGDPTFRELLGRSREAVLEAQTHADLPFDRVVEAMRPPRDTSRNPLVQVVFTLETTREQSLEFSGLRVTMDYVDTGTAKFDLNVTVLPRPEGMTVSAEYNTDLFEADTIRRLLGHFHTVLEDVAVHPDERVSRLRMLTPAERRQLVAAWNDTDAMFPAHRTVIQLFEEQVERQPEATAVVFEGRGMTYRELNARADQVARRLVGMGIGPEVLAGLCVERTPDLVVGLVGILKAGGAFLPLDPAYPDQRLAFMLRDARVPVVLTQERLQERLASFGIPVFCLDTPASEASVRAQTPTFPSAMPEHLAYVIYTSGSTGQPKGVALEHRGLTNLVHWHQQAYGVSAADRATHLAGLGFDASVWELWPYLTAGARVYLTDEAIRSSPDRLRDWLVSERISLSFVPTPLAEVLLAMDWPKPCALRAMLTGGDRLRRFAPVSLPFDLVNHYGPTEATVLVCRANVPKRAPAGPPPSIGRPIANTRLYILDGELEPVPVGVPGEVYIGGAGLARGYLGRPELTAERFVPDPFSKVPGARLYRSGDRTRFGADGAIEFLGRLDEQVKIRGFRVELGEIESVLAGHPKVRETLVVAREDADGEKRLVAYLVVNPPAPSVPDLRSYMKETLPDYMVPGALVFLDAFPLTKNGKIDRRALPEPEDLRPELPNAYVAPQSDGERLVAGIWQELLHLKQVGTQDNFFDLGGNSLLMVRVQHKLTEALGRDISIVQLFQYPTVASLARALSGSSPVAAAGTPAQDRARKQREAWVQQRQARAGGKKA
jgi:amino acid adenylation domain-containing protein